MFIVLSLFAVYLFFLGSAVAPRFKAGDRFAEYAGQALAIGILLNYAFVLTGLKFTGVAVVGGTVAAAGALRMGAAARQRFNDFRAPRWREVAWATVAAYVLAVYYFQILSEPLIRWDARSVWFFHSRIIWTDQALRASGGWTHPSIDFASPEYPNLIPALGAQLAAIKGFWNEFVPKGSLWLVLLPLVCWVFSFRRLTPSFLLLIALFFFSLHAWLWNGYMDAYIAMYAAAALLLFGRYAVERRDVDLRSAICALGICAATKDEGLLIGAVAMSTVAVVGAVVPALGLRALARKARKDLPFASAILVSVVPTGLWALDKMLWGLQSHVTGDLPAGLGRAFERVSDGSSAQYLLQFLASRATVAWLLLILIAFGAAFLRYRRTSIPAGATVALIASALYFCGMYVVYLMTPANLTWHLLTSATRVMATVSFGLLITVYFLLSSMECAEPRDGEVPTTSPADPVAASHDAQVAR